jgi:intracellular sulfur oxidation DsrE/DsrF family protein
MDPIVIPNNETESQFHVVVVALNSAIASLVDKLDKDNITTRLCNLEAGIEELSGNLKIEEELLTGKSGLC